MIGNAVDLIGRKQRRCAAAKIDCFHRTALQVVAAQFQLTQHRIDHLVFQLQRCGEVKVAVGACLPAEWYMKVYAGHFYIDLLIGLQVDTFICLQVEAFAIDQLINGSTY